MRFIILSIRNATIAYVIITDVKIFVLLEKEGVY